MKEQFAQPSLAEILTVHELASYLKTSDAKVYRMARAGDLPAFRLGKSWRFKRNMIDVWILEKTDTCEHEPNSEVQVNEKLR